MNSVIRQAKLITILLLFIATGAAAQQASADLSRYLPVDGEAAGWKLDGPLKAYHGDELFMMINGGADIYHEYGFVRVVGAAYMNGSGKSVKLEIYEMKSPAAAYGIYTFKAGEDGKALPIGQEAFFQEYYLNYWKGNLLVTVIGMDSEEETVQGIAALAKAVDARITHTGERPGLAKQLLEGVSGFSHPKYIRGAIGLMGSYIFDTENIFRVQEGMIGTVDDCRAFVFRYRDTVESTGAYEHAVTKLSEGGRFKNGVRKGDHYSMIDRDQASVLIQQTGQYISVVIGQNPENVGKISNRLIETLKRG